MKQNPKIIRILFIFIILISHNIVYSESKYRSTKEKKTLDEKIPRNMLVPDTNSPDELDNKSLELDKIFWMGIVSIPKKGQTPIPSFEDKIFKIITGAFFNMKNIQFYGQDVFIKKMKEAKISEKSIELSPKFILNMPMDINGIIILSYSYDPENKAYFIELKFSYIESGNLYKLFPEQVSESDLNNRMKSMSNTLLTKIQSIMTEYKVSQTSGSGTAEEYYKKGKSYNIAQLYAPAKKELEKAIKIDPKFVDAYIELAFAEYMGTNDHKKQIEVMEKGIKNNPNSLKLRLEIGKIYATIGDKSKAKENYNYIIIMDKEGKTEYSKEAENLIRTLYFE